MLRPRLFSRFAAAACFAVFFSCQSAPTEQTSLPDEKLARIMADLAVADAATTGLSGYTKDSLMHHYFAQVFEMHGVNSEAFEKDLRLVAQDLTRMGRIVKQAETMLGGNTENPQNPAKK